MTTAVHPASRACYLRGCREAGCSDANKRFCKQYRVERYTNGPRRVDAAPYRTLVDTYLNAGWAYSAIAELAGCSETVIFNLANDVPRISPTSARRLRALPATPPVQHPRGRAYTNAIPTMRKGRALVRIGYEVGIIAAAARIHPDALSRIINREGGLVLVTTAEAMAAVYEEWRWKPGPSLASRDRATKLGWHGPLAWDNIDDPAAEPDTEGEGYDGSKRRRDDLRTDEIQHLAGFGYSDYAIAKQVGLPVKDVHTRLGKIRAAKTAEGKRTPTTDEQVAA